MLLVAPSSWSWPSGRAAAASTSRSSRSSSTTSNAARADPGAAAVEAGLLPIAGGGARVRQSQPRPEPAMESTGNAQPDTRGVDAFRDDSALTGLLGLYLQIGRAHV